MGIQFMVLQFGHTHLTLSVIHPRFKADTPEQVSVLPHLQQVMPLSLYKLIVFSF